MTPPTTKPSAEPQPETPPPIGMDVPDPSDEGQAWEEGAFNPNANAWDIGGAWDESHWD